MVSDDFNMVKAGQDFFSSVNSTENVSSVWYVNSDVVAWILIILIVVGFFLFVVVFVKRKLLKIL